MILNIGCGENVKRGEGHLNVDIRQLPNIDIVADARKLPFKDGEHDSIVSRNLIEHFGRNEIDDLLKEWARVLKPDGTLYLETVDAGRLMDNWRNTPTENLLDGILGAQTYPENFHKMLFTEELILEKLHKAGFGVLKFTTTVHREIPRMTISAGKL